MCFLHGKGDNVGTVEQYVTEPGRTDIGENERTTSIMMRLMMKEIRVER